MSLDGLLRRIAPIFLVATIGCSSNPNTPVSKHPTPAELAHMKRRYDLAKEKGKNMMKRALKITQEQACQIPYDEHYKENITMVACSHYFEEGEFGITRAVMTNFNEDFQPEKIEIHYIPKNLEKYINKLVINAPLTKSSTVTIESIKYVAVVDTADEILLYTKQTIGRREFFTSTSSITKGILIEEVKCYDVENVEFKTTFGECAPPFRKRDFNKPHIHNEYHEQLSD